MDNRERLLIRLDALKRAVKESKLPDDQLALIYDKLFEVDELFGPGAKTHDFRELQGLGKELWQSIDVDEYIKEERESWR